MKTYDLYGAELERTMRDPLGDVRPVEFLALRLQSALGAEFDWRHSDNWNGVYFFHESDHFGKIMVIDNVTEDPDDMPYPRYRYPLIVSVDAPSDPDEIRNTLSALGVFHVRRRRRQYGRPSGYIEPSVIRGAMDIYGVRAAEIKDCHDATGVVDFLARMLKVDFAGNESAFIGQDDHYYDESVDYGEIRVSDNVLDQYGNCAFDEYADYAVIVSFFEPTQPNVLRERLASFGFTYLERCQFAATSP